jgi:two-component system chemotaxis response regulator CheY
MAFRVLVVDDSPVMRAFVRRVLDVSGLDVGAVFEAGDGVEALELLDREWVDVILTDINMPNMDGEEFVKELVHREVSAPVIVVSTDGTSARNEHLRALGICGYLAKPFLPEALRREIESAVGAGDAV